MSSNINTAYLSMAKRGGGGGTEKVDIISKSESKLRVEKSYRNGVHLFEMEMNQSIMPILVLFINYNPGMSGNLRIVDSSGLVYTYQMLRDALLNNQIFLNYFQKTLPLIEYYPQFIFSGITKNNTYTVVVYEDNRIETYSTKKADKVYDDWFDAESKSESKEKSMDEYYLNINGLNDYFAHKVVMLSQEEYDALSDANKNNGCLYLIAD
ncbi:MAG: hypothetical protein MJZ30_09410 [Paludibacteraceae bacterium]|nr:hypothetical protein [Paludibacteraceae bacterium]